jgi:prepilin-type N-terminal cleavage/methylation domain-containing protein
MKLLSSSVRADQPGLVCRAYTLVEVLTVMAVFGIIMEAVVYTHVFGTTLYIMTNAKMRASDSARVALSRMVDDIRGAKIIYVGTGNLTNFTFDATGTNQVGNSIQVYPSTNLNFYTRYFLDPASSSLNRTTNGSTYDIVVAEAITNATVFSAQDGFGNVLTNNLNNRAISVLMQFEQTTNNNILSRAGWQFFTYYQLSTVATRRVLQ